MKPEKPHTQKSPAETIADLNARCEGQDQFENFDSAFRMALSVQKDAVFKEDARWKKERAKKRARSRKD